MKNALAFDLGATSVRGILGYVENGVLKTEEVLRFSHDRVKDNDRSRWNFDLIMDNITDTIIKYKDEISTIGVDTWGVDFGLIGSDGNLIENPVSYRDAKHKIGFDKAQEKMSLLDIFLNTGNQIMSINTLFQLLALKEVSFDNYKKIDTLLLMPDLINYYLTNEKYSEQTITSTSQLFDLPKNEFSKEILNTFSIDEKIFAKVVDQGFVIGSLKNSKISKLRDLNLDIKVISVASHDTASAALLTQAYVDKETMFLSCGTWSLIGCVTDKAIVSKEVYDYSLTNECGYKGSNMFFTNITGLYLVEKLKAHLEAKYQKEIDFSEITAYVKSHEALAIFDVALDVFSQDDFDIIKEINNVVSVKVEHDFDYFVMIYRSLCDKYLKTIEHIKRISKRDFSKLHIIGGGAKSDVLCQMIADTTGLDVVVGPFEATAYGNLLIQLMSQNEIRSLQQGLDIIKNTTTLLNYEPRK